MNRLTKSWIGLILLIGTLIINGLGAFGFFNGLSQRELSDRYMTLITPAPSTFSIWSLIYILLISAAVMMIIKNKDPYYGKAIDKISYLFWLSSILNMLWIICFSYTWVGISAIVILAFAIILSLLILQLGKIQTGKQWLLPLSFGLYAGWLLIATVVNISSWLVSVNWQGFGIEVEYWGIIILIIAVIVTVVITRVTKNAIIPVPVAWGYFGIYQSLMAPEAFEGMYPSLAIVAIGGIVLLATMAVIQFYLNSYKIMPVIETEAL